MAYFRGSLLVTLLGVMAAALFGYLQAGVPGAFAGALTSLLLGTMEVSLSFDNAVVNAKVLMGMSEIWRQRFLTWGMLIAVFGMRLVFPILIVAGMSHLGVLAVAHMALASPVEYAKRLTEAHVAISMFGGAFLGLVFLNWAMDPEKDTHWLAPLEMLLARAGRLDTVQLMLVTVVVLLVSGNLPVQEQFVALSSGIYGVVLYTLIDALGNLFEEPELTGVATKSGAMSFLYLEVLDASFSFDGVIGAFAITNNILIIMAGLAIGAMFVRSLTIMLVEKGTLAEYCYLEHGAHWGIGTLAGIMFVGVFLPVPELVSGLLGVGFIGASYWSSLRAA